MSKNIKIKTEAMKSGVMLYEIADVLKIRDSSFSRMLRKELSPEKTAEILRIISEIKRGRKW